MIFLSNEDVAKVLDMAGSIEALETGYRDLGHGDAAYSPRLDIYGPADAVADGYYRWGSMAGLCRSYGVLAVRIKSDIVSWPQGRTEEKYCMAPGLYSGVILLYSQANGEPLAIIQDGYLQHMRVGAAAGIGSRHMARPKSQTLALLGSGGMAECYLDALLQVLPISSVAVYSPTIAHRERFAAKARQRFGIAVEAVADPEPAIRHADIVASATDAIHPTFPGKWIQPGTHIVNVAAQEIGADVLACADVVVQLGYSTLPASVPVPDVEYGMGAIASYLTGQPHERARLPRAHGKEQHSYPLLFNRDAPPTVTRTDDDQITLLLNAGTQGLQFAAVAGWTYRKAVELQMGETVPQHWFVEQIRD